MLAVLPFPMACIITATIQQSKNGATEFFQYIAIKTIISAPKIAGITYGEIGFNTLTISCWYIARGINPIIIIKVVTIELTAIAIVVTISCSSVPGSTLVICWAFIAQGNFKLEIFPVMKDKYCPPIPSNGAYEKASIKPMAKKPKEKRIVFARLPQSGPDFVLIIVNIGTKEIKASAIQVKTLPSLCISLLYFIWPGFNSFISVAAVFLFLALFILLFFFMIVPPYAPGTKIGWTKNATNNAPNMLSGKA